MKRRRAFGRDFTLAVCHHFLQWVLPSVHQRFLLLFVPKLSWEEVDTTRWSAFTAPFLCHSLSANSTWLLGVDQCSLLWGRSAEEGLLWQDFTGGSQGTAGAKLQWGSTACLHLYCIFTQNNYIWVTSHSLASKQYQNKGILIIGKRKPQHDPCNYVLLDNLIWKCLIQISDNSFFWKKCPHDRLWLKLLCCCETARTTSVKAILISTNVFNQEFTLAKLINSTASVIFADFQQWDDHILINMCQCISNSEIVSLHILLSLFFNSHLNHSFFWTKLLLKKAWKIVYWPPIKVSQIYIFFK